MSAWRRPRGRRWARAAVAAVGVMGLSASMAACGGGRAPDESLTIEATETGESAAALVARASESTSAIESGRMRMTMEMEFDAMSETGSATVVADGSFAQAGRQSEMTMDMGSYMRDLLGAEAGDVPESLVMRMIVDGTLMYVKFDSQPPEPGMEHWFVTDLEQQAEDMGLDPSMIGEQSPFGSGPTGYIEQLKGAGADVEATGSDTIDGVAVTRYEGTIDPALAIEKADPDRRDELERMLQQAGMGEVMPFTVWVDDDGIVRRIRQEYASETGFLTMRIVQVVDLYDLGEPVTITPPPPDQVRDASELGRSLGTA